MQQYEKTKKKRALTLFISYTVMTLAVVGISIVCILLVMGYRFDFSSQRVEQGALLQFESAPSGAQILLDGEELSFTTPGKRDVAVGAHNVMIRRDGYRSWKKEFTVRAGEVRWLNYARLVPTTLETKTIKELPTLANQLPSPDRNWIAVVAKGDVATVTMVDIRDAKETKFTDIVIPEKALTRPQNATHRYSIVEWNFGSRYVLIRHEYTGGYEYVRLDRSDPTNVVNVSSELGLTLSDIHFASESVFYGIENGNLRRLDLGANSLSEPLAKDVVSMRLYGSKDLVYVRHKDTKYVVGVNVDSKEQTVVSYDDTIPLLVDMSKYFGDHYVAISRGASFELIKSPEKTADQGMEKIITLAFPGDIKWLDISSNGRFVIAGNGTQCMTYDIELARRSDTNFPGTAADPSMQLQWLDDFLLVSSADNKLRISDFDGDNQQILTDALPSQAAVLSSNGQQLYSFSKTQTGTIALQSSHMVVEKN